MAKQPVVVITGASGLVGGVLVKHFSKLGWQVRALVRTPKAPSAHVTYYAYDLAQPFDESIFVGADYLVHTAYVKQAPQQPEAMETNISGAKRLLTVSKTAAN